MAKSFSKRWQNGEISNFQYLMHLNTLAGRGYSDLTQYPVFPWVLADYDSENINLSDPKTFRRLDKPMGCQTAQGEEEFKKRLAPYLNFLRNIPVDLAHFSAAHFSLQTLFHMEVFVYVLSLIYSSVSSDMRAGMIQRYPNSIMALTILVLELSSSISSAFHLSVLRIKNCRADNLTMQIVFSTV